MSVCIPINDKYRLTTDPLQVQKHSGHLKDGTIIWKPIGFYVSPEQAINNLDQRMIRESDTTTLIELRKTAESLATLLSPAYTEALEVSADIVKAR